MVTDSFLLKSDLLNIKEVHGMKDDFSVVYIMRSKYQLRANNGDILSMTTINY